jgi:hypothetical protein
MQSQQQLLKAGSDIKVLVLPFPMLQWNSKHFLDGTWKPKEAVLNNYLAYIPKQSSNKILHLSKEVRKYQQK